MTVKPGALQSWGSWRVRHDLGTEQQILRYKDSSLGSNPVTSHLPVAPLAIEPHLCPDSWPCLWISKCLSSQWDVTSPQRLLDSLSRPQPSPRLG